MTDALSEAAPAGSGPYPGRKRWPLSYAQELLWFLGRRWPDADLPTKLTVTMTDTVTGPLDLAAFRAAIADVLARHEVLRSALVVEDGEAKLVVVDDVEAPLRLHDLTGLPEQERRAAADRLVLAAGGRVPAYEAPPIRFELVSVEPDVHHLVVAGHHLFFDYWSARLLRAELHQAYQARLTGRPPAPAADLQYVDFAAWERDVTQSPAMQEGLDFWVERLADLPPLLLPTDRPRPWTQTGAARRAVVLLPPELVAAVQELGRRHRASPFMVLGGVFLCLLSELTGHRDVAIPTIFSGRIHPATQEMMGYFDNLLFLRYQRDETASVDTMLNEVRDAVMAAYEHHDVPMLRIIEQQPRLLLLLANAVNVWTLFHLEVDPYRLRGEDDGVTVPGDGAPSAGDPDGFGDAVSDDEEVYSFGADLDVTLRETDEALYIRVLYNTDLFDPATVTGMLDRFRTALERAVENPARPVAELFAVPAESS